jgi:hypothetical protein
MTAAAVSGTIDTTVALASLNFDFSLIKVEARKRVQGFWNAIIETAQRRS